jgi:hypothetical protein
MMRYDHTLSLAVVALVVACVPPSTLTPEAAEALTVPGLYLNPGAVVRAQLHDDRIVTGPILVRFTPDSTALTVCDSTAGACLSSTAAGSLRLRLADIRRLAVRGKAAGVGAYGGALVGGLVGAIMSSERKASSIGVGLVGGSLIGTAIGSRTTTWVPVFPCWHACARGEYPAR